MAYTETAWVDNSTPPIDAANLNKIEAGIFNAGAPAATVTVAASNASAKWKAAADYVCTGSADQTTINNAIAALPAGGGIVQLSEGLYSVSSGIVCTKDGVWLRGSGMGVGGGGSAWSDGSYGTTILAASGFTARGILDFNADSSSRCVDSCAVSDLNIDGNKVGSQGVTDGIYFSARQSLITNVYVFDCNARGIHVKDYSGSSTAYRTRILGRVIVGFNGTGGVWMNCTDAGICGGGEFYNNAGPGLQIGGAMAVCSGFMTWGNVDALSGGQGCGIQIDSGCARVAMVGIKIEQNAGGIYINGGTEFVINGCTFASNSVAGNIGAPSVWASTSATTNEYDDIHIGSASNIAIVGNVLDGGVYGANQLSRYNLFIGTGAANIFASLNRFTGAGTAATSIAGGLTNVTVTNNF